MECTNEMNRLKMENKFRKQVKVLKKVLPDLRKELKRMENR